MKVIYHQDGREPVALTVLSRNADGTVNIGPEGKTADGKDPAPVITSVEILETPRSGYVTFEDAVDAKAYFEQSRAAEERRIKGQVPDKAVTGLLSKIPLDAENRRPVVKFADLPADQKLQPKT